MAKNSLWRKVSSEEKLQIKEDSKHLLTEFAKSLEKIKATKTPSTKNNSGTRQEGSGWKTSEEFCSTTLSNAPYVEENFIVAEKGSWKK